VSVDNILFYIALFLIEFQYVVYIFVSINQSLKAHTNVPQVTFPDFSL